MISHLFAQLQLLDTVIDVLTGASLVGGFLFFTLGQAIRLNNLYKELIRRDKEVSAKVDNLSERYNNKIKEFYELREKVEGLARAINNVQRFLASQDNEFKIRRDDSMNYF